MPDHPAAQAHRPITLRPDPGHGPLPRLCRGARGLSRRIIPLLAMLALPMLPVQAAVSLDKGELRALQTQALTRIAASPLRGGIVIESAEADDLLRGVLVAKLRHTIDEIAAVMSSSQSLCEMLVLNVHIHACTPTAQGLRIGFGNPAGDPGSVREIDYVLSRSPAAQDGVLHQRLRADKGPLGTGDYQIDIEVLPIESGQSLVRYDYRYRIGMMGRMAMSAYLSTAGRSKIGFSLEPPAEGAAPEPIGGLRGSLERNLMRYHLAMAAYLDAAATPAAGRTDARLRRWFELTEHFPAQLHEQTLDEFLKAKQRERAAVAANPSH